MRLESNAPVEGEPDGGWVTAAPSEDSAILELVAIAPASTEPIEVEQA